ncbi:YdaS family helix-turn-helix protein [Acidithiobacillus sp.]|uniref:transcriptional regulator n=1 Tax=Acidithiobacillus sp. TaxID=1872118 RepID=UPI00345A07DC
MDSPSPIQKAISAAGSQSALGRLVGVSQPAVRKWACGLSQPSAKSALSIERELGISRYELLPHVFGPDPSRTDIFDPLPPTQGDTSPQAQGPEREPA